MSSIYSCSSRFLIIIFVVGLRRESADKGRFSWSCGPGKVCLSLFLYYHTNLSSFFSFYFHNQHCFPSRSLNCWNVPFCLVHLMWILNSRNTHFGKCGNFHLLYRYLCISKLIQTSLTRTFLLTLLFLHAGWAPYPVKQRDGLFRTSHTSCSPGVPDPR